MVATVSTPRLTPSWMRKGSFDPGFGSEHGSVPSMVSLGCTPAWRAARRMNSLADDPVWRGVMARFTCDWSKPFPPTMATTAPVLASSAARAAWNRPPVSGS